LAHKIVKEVTKEKSNTKKRKGIIPKNKIGLNLTQQSEPGYRMVPGFVFMEVK